MSGGGCEGEFAGTGGKGNGVGGSMVGGVDRDWGGGFGLRYPSASCVLFAW